MTLPTIGITMGDAAGISPEILVKSLADPAIRTFCEPIVLGDVRVLAAAAKTAGLDLAFRTVERPSVWRGEAGAFGVVELSRALQSLCFPLAGMAPAVRQAGIGRPALRQANRGESGFARDREARASDLVSRKNSRCCRRKTGGIAHACKNIWANPNRKTTCKTGGDEGRNREGISR